MTFESLGLKAPLLGALRSCGYDMPTPIQVQAIPPALEGRDVLGTAQTGTGKTCAFGTPIIQRLHAAGHKESAIRALILTPTRELAIQIEESLKDYSKGSRVRSTVIFGGVGQAPQVEAIRRGVDILTATPGRLMDLQNQKLLDLSTVEVFVLDEADRMLDMGFIHDVKRIVATLPRQKQTLFFSATMPPEIMDLVNSLMKDPVRVAADPPSSPVERIDQRLYMVDRGNKTKLLAHILREEAVKNALVFTRTKHGADKVTRELVRAGVKAAAIHGNKSQTARQAALLQFKQGTLQVLVATDIAARGLDIEELSHVFNYNLPEVPETYIHRIGRTARAGLGGTAIAFAEFAEKPLLKGVEALLGKPVPLVAEHPWPMEELTPLKRDGKGRLVNADDEEARAAARVRNAERRAAAGAQAKPGAPKQGAEGRAQSAPRSKPVKRPFQIDELPEAGAAAPAELLRRKNPLAGDVIMDATARLLAATPRVFRKPAAPAQSPKRNKGKEEGRAPKDAANRAERRGGKPASPVEAPPRGEIPAPAQGGQKKGGAASKPTVQRTAKSRGGRRKAPPVEAPRSHQKDSTEQPSLMKPFYLDHD